MKRVHLFEFTDQHWYPQIFRCIQTDYLQFAATRGTGHENLVPLIRKAMSQTGTSEILDLCSGGSGPWARLKAPLELAGGPVTVRLTDLFPDPEAIRQRADGSHGAIEYIAEPVDALAVPANLRGMRTIFEGFHHFRPTQARTILQNAADQRTAIGAFEAALKPSLRPLMLLLAPLMTVLGYLFATPFIKPRTAARFFWTYVMPIVPLATCWDGVVSLLRVYSPAELRALVDSVQCDHYEWEIGQLPTKTPLFVFIYLVGYPTSQ